MPPESMISCADDTAILSTENSWRLAEKAMNNYLKSDQLVSIQQALTKYR